MVAVTLLPTPKVVNGNFAELASGLADKLNLDTYLIGQSLPGVPVTDGIEMAYFPKLPLTTLGVGNKVTATIDPKMLIP
jgi:hypothetical protein